MIANPHELYLPGLESVSYPPKKINTVAVKVTTENIGALSLEFESELCYFNNGVPFFETEVSRGTEAEPKPARYLQIRPGDWIVVLWDEYHLFRENEFQHTFRVNHAGLPDEPPVDRGSLEVPPVRSYASGVSLLPEVSSK
jgi:hypothetical protein